MVLSTQVLYFDTIWTVLAENDTYTEIPKVVVMVVAVEVVVAVKLRTDSLIYCIIGHYGNRYDIRYALHRIYMTNILYVQCLSISLHND